MNNMSSQPIEEFDQFLLSIEELFRQRLPEKATRELRRVSAEDYQSSSLASGLYLSLLCEAELFEGKYVEAIDAGTEALRILAPSSMNRRVGRTLWNLSRSYSLKGDLPEAELRARDAISSYRRSEFRPGVVDGLNELAKISFIKSEYPRSVEFLQDALALLGHDPAKEQQIRSNLGRVKTLAGQWADAYYLLSAALEYDEKNNLEISAARNHLSLGYLRSRQRRFGEALERYTAAETLINKHNLVREKLILKEYRGELALEKGDYREARSILTAALEASEKLAPDSALVTQIGRMLSQALMGLELIDKALSMSQRTLERSEKLGERVEIGLCNVLVGAAFARSATINSSEKEAVSYFERGLQILREVGDPLEVGKALLRAPGIYGSGQNEKSLECLHEARRTLSALDVDYYNAIAALSFARTCFDSGRFSEGYQPLCEARELFDRMGDQAHNRQVESLTKSVATEAVALSLSQNNSFNLFGEFATDCESAAGQAADFEKSVETVRVRTESDRAVVLSLENETPELHTTPFFSDAEKLRFSESFSALLGQEIGQEKPTLLLDSSRDPYVNGLLPTGARDVVASVIVTPLRVSGELVGYMYLDRVGPQERQGQSRPPYSQDDLNFAVGYSDFVALELAQAQKAKIVEDNIRLKAQMQQKVGFPNIITRNPEMVELLARVRQVVDSDISISIHGETGVGKDLLAKAIHYNSSRRDKKFISVNCAALPETLLESELFGYRRGAFTGADRDKPGLFEEADGGTFFMDEIGDMPLTIQAKLLRTLEEKEVMRLGDSATRSVDVRVISATHKNLQSLLDSGEFRHDLYYRLSALSFSLPPLRERREDIPLLIERLCADPGTRIPPEVMQALVSYDWPGNIRELENEIKKLCLLSGESKVIAPEMLSAKITSARESLTDKTLPLDIAVGSADRDFSLYEFIASHEKQFIASALSKSRGVKKHAAALLNIPESTLRLKIKQYDIDARGSRLNA
ncbi:MAG: sigma 54-interacting transcriptional regulator [Candidatus Zixiibacteriota bacterium]